MMLDCKYKSSHVIECSKIIPLDKEAKDSIPYLRDVPFQTKVELYDKKCSGCGFARIELIRHDKPIAFNNLHQAILNMEVGDEINRTCDYPGNIQESTYGDIYPTLTEIIMNGCMLWDSKNYPVENNEVLETLTLVKNEQIEVPDRQIP